MVEEKGKLSTAFQGFYDTLSTKNDEIPAGIYERRGKGKAEGGKG